MTQLGWITNGADGLGEIALEDGTIVRFGLTAFAADQAVAIATRPLTVTVAGV